MAIVTLYGLRHANAAQSEEPDLLVDPRAIDLARPLTRMNGMVQAQERARSLAAIPFDRVISSPAERAKRTAELIARCHRHAPIFHVCDELYTPTDSDGDVFNAIFDDIGHQPASAYLAHSLNSDKDEEGRGPVERLAAKAGVAIADTIGSKDRTILIAGHGVYTPLAVLGLFEHAFGFGEVPNDLYALLTDVNMEETGMFKIVYDETNPITTTFTELK